jgi:hypothetical protein
MRTPTGRLPKHPRPGTKLGAVMLALWHAAQDTTRPLCPWMRLGEVSRATGATKGATSANLLNLRRRGFVCRSTIEVPEHGEVWVYCLTDWGAAAAAQVFGPGPATPEA